MCDHANNNVEFGEFPFLPNGSNASAFTLCLICKCRLDWFESVHDIDFVLLLV